MCHYVPNYDTAIVSLWYLRVTLVRLVTMTLPWIYLILSRLAQCSQQSLISSLKLSYKRDDLVTIVVKKKKR